MEIVILIILIVFAILQIILFFKVWGMTNNVSRIKSQICDIVEIDKSRILVEIYKKNPKISDILFDNMYYDFRRVYNTSAINETMATQIIQYYKPLYELANIHMPELFLEIKTNADYRKYFR